MSINYKLSRSMCFFCLIGLLATSIVLANDNHLLNNKEKDKILETKQKINNSSKKLNKFSIIKNAINSLAIFALGYSIGEDNTTNNYQIKMHIDGNNNNNNQINLQKTID